MSSNRNPRPRRPPARRSTDPTAKSRRRTPSAGRPDRSARPDRRGGFDRAARPDRSASPERGGRPERSARPDRPARPERAGRPERFARPDRKTKPERGGRPERSARPDRPARPERAGRPERFARPDRKTEPGRGGRPDRARRTERSARPDRETPPVRAGQPNRSARPARRPPRERVTPRATESSATQEGERLQKILAHAGIASRRAAEQLMLAGRVWVDGRPATTLGMRVDPETSQIEVDGQRVHIKTDHEYVLLNKPAGVVTTVTDPQGRPTVLDLVKSDRRLYPVGRLDADTQGLLLMTDDGELTHRLSHPRYEIPRTYLAEVKGLVPPAAIRRLTTGVRLEDGPARAKSAKIVRGAGTRTQVELVLTEGRKREVRRMLDAVGFPVLNLVRTRFGPLNLKALKVGRTRRLNPQEVGELHKLVGL